MRSAQSIKLYFFLWNFLYHVHGTKVKNITSAVARQIRSIDFPESSGAGIFFALAIPIDIPEKSIALAMYFEANYGLPVEKSSSFFNKYITKRSIDRQMAYEILENNLNRAGFPGRVCLLRTVCETAKQPISGNGLIGDIIQVLLTPSSSLNTNLSADFIAAETAGNCQDLYSKCPTNLLDLIIHELN